jgi:hypothetical protein
MAATETKEGEGLVRRIRGESPEDEAAIAAANKIPEGTSIDDLAEGEAEAPQKPMQIPLPGTLETISSTVGGPKPTSSEARLLGGSLPIEGQFPLDETVTLLVEVKVGAVEVVSTTDDWGNVKSVKRRHKMRMLSVRRFGT